MPIGMDEDTLLNVLLCMGGTRKLEGLLLDGDAVPGTTVRGGPIKRECCAVSRVRNR